VAVLRLAATNSVLVVPETVRYESVDVIVPLFVAISMAPPPNEEPVPEITIVYVFTELEATVSGPVIVTTQLVLEVWQLHPVVLFMCVLKACPTCAINIKDASMINADGTNDLVTKFFAMANFLDKMLNSISLFLRKNYRLYGRKEYLFNHCAKEWLQKTLKTTHIAYFFSHR